MTSRQPIYAEKQPHVRIISAPNGQWVAQRFVGRPEGTGKVNSGWQNVGRATEQAVAMQTMNAVATTFLS